MEPSALDTAVIVPARLNSVRFPRKLLHEIKGRPLILWTAERLAQVCPPDLPVFYAVEDEELEALLLAEGLQVFRTAGDHLSGTDRIAEVNQHLGASHVLNVQADEPLVTARQIQLLYDLIHGGADMATLAFPLDGESDFRNPNCVKVVMDAEGRALYFSRSPIPYPCGEEFPLDSGWFQRNLCYHHMGVYAYHGDFLSAFSTLPQGRLEQLERLEQLRALENGYAIAVGISDQPTVGIDAPEDATRFVALLDLKG